MARLLGRDRAVGRVIAADHCLRRAKEAAEISGDKCVALRLDPSDDYELSRVLGDVAVTVNTLTPSLDLLLSLMRSVVEAGVSYVDANDDPESLQAVFDSEYLGALSGHRAVGVIPGLGASPGQTNAMVQYLSQRLDRLENARLFHVDDIRLNSLDQWQQRLSAFGSPALVWRDGDWRHVAPLSEFEEVFFPSPWGVARCYIVGVRPVSLPVSMPTLTELSGYRGFADEEAEEAMLGVVRYGLAGEAPVATQVGTLTPAQFVAAYFSGPWSPFAARSGEPLGLPRQLLVQGQLKGQTTRFTMTWSFPKEREEENIASPLALGARLLLTKELPAVGLHPPERLDPAPFLWDMERRGVEIQLTKTTVEG